MPKTKNKKGVSTPPPKKKNQKNKKKTKVKNWFKLKLKIGPSMLRNIIGPMFLASKNVFCCSLFCFFYILLSAGGTRFSKTKTNKKNNELDQYLTLKRANVGPVLNFTALFIYLLYIYRDTCAGELVAVPLFLPFQELETVPLFERYHVLQQPQANQEFPNSTPES